MTDDEAMVSRVLKWPVPIDDSDHPIGTGSVVHVDVQDAGDPGLVYVWTIERGEPALRRKVRVFGTGQPIPADVRHHVGSVVTAGGALVWHVFETGWLPS